jgi:hypothetical protein
MTKTTFDDLKRYMVGVKTVHEFNERREQAKKEFSIDLIRRLDSSGYINELIKPVPADQN